MRFCMNTCVLCVLSDVCILRALATGSHGYVAELDQLSASDMLNGSSCGGGERSLLHGFTQIVKALRKQCVERSKKNQCYFRIRHGRTVNVVEQLIADPSAASSSSPPAPPLLICYCPNQREMYVSRFVVCTPSVGIMHNSLQFDMHMQQRHGHLLQQQPCQLQSYDTLLKRKPKEEAKKGTSDDMDGELADLSSSLSSASIASEPAAHQLRASILFAPPLSQTKVRGFSELAMVSCKHAGVRVRAADQPSVQRTCFSVALFRVCVCALRAWRTK